MMNNKALVEVIIPAAGAKFDAFIPLDSKMSQVLKLLAHVMSEMSAGKYKASDDAVLCDADTGIIFNINMEVAELHIKNGSRLMLI